MHDGFPKVDLPDVVFGGFVGDDIDDDDDDGGDDDDDDEEIESDSD